MAAASSRSTRRARSCSRRAWRWWRIPTTSGIKPLFGTDVITPLFHARVPVRAHPLANPEKGTGVAMICTFGDVTDVTWWRELSLPVRAVLLPDGRFRPITWGSRRVGDRRDPARAQAAYDQLAGLSAHEGAREDRRAARRDRRSARRRASDHAPGEVLREGRSAARDHHEPAVVRQDHSSSARSCSRAAAS